MGLLTENIYFGLGISQAAESMAVGQIPVAGITDNV
jgi:hypothetical protein